MEDAGTTTNDVNDVIASSHGLQLRSTVLLGRARCQVFANHFSGYPRPRKAKVKISEMTAGIWQSLPPLSAPFSPTLDKSLNSEHPVSRGAKFGQLAKAHFVSNALVPPLCLLIPVSSNDFNSQVTMRLTVRGRFWPENNVYAFGTWQLLANLCSYIGDKPPSLSVGLASVVAPQAN
jgi:hypothetical protein